jgi:hypothetical protein
MSVFYSVFAHTLMTVMGKMMHRSIWLYPPIRSPNFNPMRANMCWLCTPGIYLLEISFSQFSCSFPFEKTAATFQIRPFDLMLMRITFVPELISQFFSDRLNQPDLVRFFFAWATVKEMHMQL